MLISYRYKNFRDATLEVIDRANQIIQEYVSMGMDLTLRQLYYQFVARGLMENTVQAYGKLGSIINDARLAGLVSWKAINDRTRNLVKNTHWDNPAQIIQAAHDGYQLDRWAGQEFRPEVWIEKEALIGVISSVCAELDVAYFACKGYVSQSYLWRASVRLDRFNEAPVIIHLGDHDPSGVDMTRDLEDRLEMFGVYPKINRIALNMDQVEEFNPPPNPAKLTDTRAADYISRFGYESWELDALEPRMMQRLVEETILSYREDDVYEAVMEREQEDKDHLLRLIENEG